MRRKRREAEYWKKNRKQKREGAVFSKIANSFIPLVSVSWKRN
jgi:hypothetical protein